MMSMDLRDYVKIYDNFIEQKVCKQLVRKIKKLEWRKHSYNDATTNTNTSYDDDLSVTFNDQLEECTEINQKIWFALEQYIIKDYAHMPWHSSWSGYTKIRLNRYDVGTRMRTHCDHIHTVFDGKRKGVPVLTVLGSLNNDYEGGELVLWESEVVQLKAGQIIIFPSNFLYPHRVDPIKKGTRYSYVSWVW